MPAAALPIPDDDAYVVHQVTTSTSGPFAVPFPLPLDHDSALHVAIDGVEIESDEFSFEPDTASAAGYPTGEVTLNEAVETCTVEIWRDVPITRQSDYGAGPLDVAGFNTELARLTMQVQDARLRNRLAQDLFGGPASEQLVAAVGDTTARTLGEWMAALLSGALTSVTATGSTTARSLADRFAEYVRPEDFGAVGDGVTDDTVAFQAALDSMSASECLVLRPGATYSVKNVKLPTLIAAYTGRAGIACMFGTATIKARAGGDTGYLVAGKKWITATKTDFSNEPWLFENVIFDANGVSDWAVILKTYWGRYTNCDFINGVVGGCKLTRQNQDGSAIDSGALNPGNVFDRCFFQDNGTYAFRNEGTAADAAAASTDCWLVNCGFDGNAVTDYNIYMGTCDGWQIRGNHTSGSTTADAYFLSVGIAASIGGNEFEGLVIVVDVGAYGYCQIGPANMFRTGLRYDGADDTGAEVCTVVGNNFHKVAGGSKAQCTLNDNSRSAKVLFGINNSFEHAKPYVRGSSASGVLKWSGGYSTDGIGNLGDGQYDNGATEGPYDDLFSDSDSPANSDIVGVRRHLGRDSAGNWQEYAATRGVIGSPTNGSENGRYEIRVTRSGASVTKLSFGGGIFGTGMSDGGDGTVNIGTAYHVNNVKVVGAQGAAVVDASGGATVDTEARAALNALLARLRAHGLIAT